MTNPIYQKCEITLIIPRKDTSFSFIHQEGTSSCFSTRNKICKFIKKNTNDIEINKDIINQWIVTEFVKNSYDSFGEFCLKRGDDLTLKVVMYIKNRHLFIKFKDNANGFFRHKKGVPFQYQLSSDATEKPDYCLGGEHIGLDRTVHAVTKKGRGDISFKNRKDTGSTITIQLPIAFS